MRSASSCSRPAGCRLLPIILILYISIQSSVTAASHSALSENNTAEENQQHLVPLDWIREQDSTATRSGIIDLVKKNKGNDDDQTQQQQELLGFCHIAAFIPLSKIKQDGRKPLGTIDLILSGISAFYLALDMLNKGDGSVINEIEGINDWCPIKFTGEIFDTALYQSLTVHEMLAVLDRTTPKEREVCAFLGAVMSSVSIPMASITGIFGRPQLSPLSTSSQLDDVENYPLFGRLITSNVGLSIPFILYLKRNNVQHLGVLHWNDDYGNEYVRALLQTATDLYPELNIVAADIPSIGATQADFQVAVQTLARTQYRWFFALFGTADYAGIMPLAFRERIAGTGKHVWILNSATATGYLSSLTLEKGSPLAEATRGVGMYAPQNGLPGMRAYDKFVERWRALENPQDMDYIASKLPHYPDEPDFDRPPVSSSIFDQDPSVSASVFFDETIMFGLSACKAAKQAETDDGTLFVDGKTMFDSILSTTFGGASGNVTLDPKTGSRLPTTAIFRISNVVEVPVNATHVTYEVQGSDVFVGGEWVEKEPYIFNDGTTRTPDDLPSTSTDMNYIGTSLRAVGLAMALLVVLASVLFASWTIYQRNEYVIRASQPIFLLILCAGTLIMSSAIIPLSIDDETSSYESCRMACMAVPWLTSVGFALIFAALFSKTWRVNRIFNHPGMRRIKLKANDVMLPLVVLVVLHVIVLSVWTIVSPFEWSREIVVLDGFGRARVSRGFCASDGSFGFGVALALLDIGALVLASHQSYVARSITTEFAESEYIGKAIACMLLVSLVSVPTMVIVSDEPRARYFVLTCIIFVVCSAVLLFVFVPKLLSKKRGGDAKAQWTQFSSGSSSSDAFRPSDMPEGIEILSGPQQIKEVHEKNMELQKEVEDLQRRCTQAEKMVATLKDSPPESATSTSHRDGP